MPITVFYVTGPATWKNQPRGGQMSPVRHLRLSDTLFVNCNT